MAFWRITYAISVLGLEDIRFLSVWQYDITCISAAEVLKLPEKILLKEVNISPMKPYFEDEL